MHLFKQEDEEDEEDEEEEGEEEEKKKKKKKKKKKGQTSLALIEAGAVAPLGEEEVGTQPGAVGDHVRQLTFRLYFPLPFFFNISIM